MPNYKIIFLLFVAMAFILTGFIKTKNAKIFSEAKWTGTVSFFEKKSGGELALSEWRMEANIVNDTGTAVHTSITRGIHGDHSFCRTAAKTELDLGIDEEKNEYSISVAVPGCYGTVTDQYGKTDSMGVTDETAIFIDHQKLGKDHNILSGQIKTTDGPDTNGATTVTIYEWNLKKVK